MTKTRSVKCMVMMLLACFALEACGEDKQNATKKAPETAAPATQSKDQPAGSVNQVAEDAKQKGANKDCMGRITNMSAFLIGNGQYSSVTYAAPKDADENLFSATIAHKGQDGTHLAFMDVASDDNCSADYEVVKVWSNNCEQVAANAFKGYAFKGQMANGTFMFESSPTTHIFAMPTAGQGCVTIQKNVIFEKK